MLLGVNTELEVLSDAAAIEDAGLAAMDEGVESGETAEFEIKSRYEHRRPCVAQLWHEGRASSHFLCSCLQFRQPKRDFVCGRLMIGGD